jgi:hypothetical protein
MTIDDDKVLKSLEAEQNYTHKPAKNPAKRKRKTIKYGNKGFINSKNRKNHK